MLATNPVQPHTLQRIEILGVAGPHEEWPRRHESSPFPVAKFAGFAGAVLAAYVILGTLGASGAQPVQSPAGAPVAKEAPVAAPVVKPVPGEFRLGPGNLEAPGIVSFDVPAPMPGEFRLAPGNNQPAGIVQSR